MSALGALAPLRRFVILGQTAAATPDFSLDDVPGTSGRLDVLLRCLAAALLVSHGLRRYTCAYLVLSGGGARALRVDGRVASYLRPDERAMAGRVRAMLATKAERGFDAERQGMAIADGGLELVLADVGDRALYVLEEDGEDLRHAALDVSRAVFFVGDHLGFAPDARAELARAGGIPIRVGPISVHADHAITIVHNELDRRATSDER
jgi:tRNA (pseudouridine54-N1)-methyltransferase